MTAKIHIAGQVHLAQALKKTPEGSLLLAGNNQLVTVKTGQGAVNVEFSRRTQYGAFVLNGHILPSLAQRGFYFKTLRVEPHSKLSWIVTYNPHPRVAIQDEAIGLRVKIEIFSYGARQRPVELTIEDIQP